MRKDLLVAVLLTISFNTLHGQDVSANIPLKCLYGDWTQLSHHKGQGLSFDTTKKILKIKRVNGLEDTCKYFVIGDSLTLASKDTTQKFRFGFTDCDHIIFYVEIDHQTTARYIRKRNKIDIH